MMKYQVPMTEVHRHKIHENMIIHSYTPTEARRSEMASKHMMTFCLSIDSSSVRPRGGLLGNRGVSWYNAPQMLINDDTMHMTL